MRLQQSPAVRPLHGLHQSTAPGAGEPQRAALHDIPRHPACVPGWTTIRRSSKPGSCRPSKPVDTNTTTSATGYSGPALPRHQRRSNQLRCSCNPLHNIHPEPSSAQREKMGRVQSSGTVRARCGSYSEMAAAALCCLSSAWGFYRWTS